MPILSDVFTSPEAAARLKVKESALVDFNDYPRIRQEIFDGVLETVQKTFPVSNEKYIITADNIGYADPDRYTKKDQRETLLTNANLARKLTANLRTYDRATGKLISSTGKKTLMNVPYMTDMGTFIRNGTEYAIIKQFRLVPSIYTRVTADGLYESQFNIKPRTGVPFRIYMEPETSLFFIKSGGRKIPLFPVLRSLGVTDDEMKKTWGNQIFTVNQRQRVSPYALRWIKEVAKKGASYQEKEAALPQSPESNDKIRVALTQYFENMALDPEATVRTVGIPYKNVNKDAILTSTNKILKLAKGQAEADDRDSLAYQTVHDFRDFITDKIRYDQNGVMRQLLWKITTRQGDLSRVPSGVLDKHLSHLFNVSGVAQCFDKETFVLTKRGFVPWPEVTEDDLFACSIKGYLEYHKAKKFYRYVYNGPMYGCKTNSVSYLVTPDHRCAYATRDMQRERGCYDPRDPATLKILTAKELHGKQAWFCSTLPKIKIVNDIQFYTIAWVEDRWGNKKELQIELSLWAEFLGWYISEGYSYRWKSKNNSVEYGVTIAQKRTVNPDNYQKIKTLLHQIGIPFSYSDKTWSFRIRHKGLCLELLSLGQSREKRIPRWLFETSPEILNIFFEAYLRGDGCVGKNYTKMCTASPGLAADLVELIGRLGYKGHWGIRRFNNTKWANSNVVSVCKTLMSTVSSLNAVKNKGQKDNYYIVNYNDMVYCADVPGGLLYVMRNGRPLWMGNCIEEINPADMFGQNRRVTRLGEGALPSVESAPDDARNVQPSYLGYVDLLRSPECYSADMEVWTEQGWKSWPSVNETDRFACLINGRLEYHEAEKIVSYPYDGIMYGGESAVLSYLVTPEHRMWVRLAGSKSQRTDFSYRYALAKDIHKKKRIHNNGLYLPLLPIEEVTEFRLPIVKRTSNFNKILTEPINLIDWCSFMGWFIAEGSVTINENTHTYVVDISQSKKTNPSTYEEIRQLLTKLPFNFTENYRNKGFRICNKQLAVYLKQFGYCYDKFIPSEIFRMSVECRKAFLDAFGKGDGRKRRGKVSGLCTSSTRLAKDLQKLCTELGMSTALTFEPDDREERYLGCWVLYLHTRSERELSHKAPRYPAGQLYTTSYKGTVYCATVPGGLLYVRRNQKSGFWCGNSLRVGLDSYFARNVRKGPNNMIYTKFLDAQTGVPSWVDARTASGSVIGFPESINSKDKYVPALWKSKGISYVPKKEVQYYLMSGDDAFSTEAESVPLKSGVKGMRLLLGTKYLSHALPLKYREAPYVQSVGANGKPTMENLGKFMGAISSPKAGIVTRVGKDNIWIRYDDGTVDTVDLYNQYPLARKTNLHNTPIVKTGDTVKKNQILAISNFTDEKGTAAPGINLRVAYMNYKGYNYEDATVISKSAAQKLTSELMYQHSLDEEEGIKVGLKKFRTLFPAKFTKEQLAKIGPEGVIQEGQVLNYGDPIILATQDKIPSLAAMGRRKIIDQSVTWDKENSGKVVHIARTRDGITVYTLADTPTQIADKLAVPFGGKGVVATIVNDEDMPRDKNGKPVDIILSPLGIVSRTNPSQLLVAALGKVSEKTGKKYVLPGFMDQNLTTFVENELKQAGLDPSGREDIYDPGSKKTIPSVFIGNIYTYKLQQTAESKGKARSIGEYSQDEEPSRGGGSGCFPGQQMIKTLNGNIRISRIVEKKLSEHVWAYNKETDSWGYYPITNWFVYEAKIEDILQINIIGADSYCRGKKSKHTSTLYPTKNHKIYLYTGEIKEAKDLVVGDELITWGSSSIGKEKVKIIAINPYKHPKAGVTNIPVYDFTVGTTHNYTVASALVSNSKHYGDMELQSLLSHGVPNVIKDLKLIKGQKNTDFWRQLKLGQTPVSPTTPFVYDKFKALIQAGGVNLVEAKDSDNIFAMTDEDAKKLTGNRRIENAGTFSATSLKPIPGGLFDPDATGSLLDGNRFSYIDLDDPMLNPVMETPIRTLLGLTQKEFNNIVAGRVPVEGGKIGGEALKQMLDKLNLPNLIRQSVEDIKSGSPSKRDKAIRTYGYANALLKAKAKPSDFIMTRIPVLPPKYRPISRQGMLTMVSDMNYMYKELMSSMDDLRDTKELPISIQNDARIKVYNNYKALVGLTDPDKAELKSKQIGGILQQLFGSGSPKTSYVQRKVIGTNIDISGLAVITPNPSLRLNQVGLPETKAWDLYEPFVIRDLVLKGIPATVAANAVKDKTKLAYRSLQEVVRQRPVMINRAPTLHKYSIMAFWPVLTKGNTLQISPSIVAPFNADMDGDSVQTMTWIQVDLKKSLESLVDSQTNGTLDTNSNPQYLKNHLGENIMSLQETSVATVNATIRISDMPVLENTKVDKGNGITEWDVPKGIKIVTIDRNTGQQRLSPITKFSVHENCKLFDVTLGKTYAKTITVSEDHSVVAYNNATGTIDLCRPEESSSKMIPCSKEAFESDPDIIRAISLKGLKHNIEQEYSLDLSFDMGFFLGMLIGDGWVDSTYVTYCAIFDNSLREVFIDITKKLNGNPVLSNHERINLSGKMTTSKKVRCNLPTKLSVVIKNAIGSGAINKTIPWQCLSGPKAHLVGLFAGLMNTDGCISSGFNKRAGKEGKIHCVRYDTISPYLRDAFSYLCLKLGMQSSTTSYKSTLKGTQAYGVTISLPDFVRFCKENPNFKLYPENKRIATEKIITNVDIESGAAVCADLVPYPVFAHKHLLAVNGHTQSLFIHNTELSTHKKRGYLTRHTAQKLVDAYRSSDISQLPKETQDSMKFWCSIVENSKITWKPVISVMENGIDTCYDITVPDTFTFATASGVFVQDTMSFTVPVSKSAVNEAIEKMMPDTNLLSVRHSQPNYMPRQEYSQGLYYSTKEPKNRPPIVFASKEEALRAYKSGKIDIDDPIVIK